MTNSNECCLSWRNPKTIILLAAILVVGGIVALALVRERIINDYGQRMSFTGQGKVAYKPDTANITLGVQIDNVANAENALNDLNSKMAKIKKVIENLNIAEENILLQNYSLTPQYNMIDNIQKVTGYSANQLIVVKITDLEKNADSITKIIAAANVAGANQINGVSFTTSKLEELKQEARLLAIANAKKKAEELSPTLKIRLKKIVNMWENLIYIPEMMNSYPTYYYDGKGGAGPMVPNGNQEIILEVTLEYKVK